MREVFRLHGRLSWLLLPILGLGAWLRLWNLPDRGLLYWDEGKFTLEGLRILGEMQALVGLHGSSVAGKAIGTAKPTHALLIALSFALLGVHDYSPLILEALCSIATVVVVYVLTEKLFDRTTAVVAALFLAVSGYDVMYARSALSESDANLLFVLGTLLWALSWVRDTEGRWQPGAHGWRIPAALLLGLGFSANYRLATYIAVVVALDIVLLIKRRAGRHLLRSAAFWAGGLAAFPLMWEVVGLAVQAGGGTLFQSEITYHRTTYLAEALYQLHQGRQSVFHFAPAPYVEWFAVRQGLPASVLVVAGLVMAIARRTVSLLVPATLVMVPYLVYVVAPLIVPRNLDTAVPFTAMLSAAVLVSLARKVRPAAGRHAALVGATLVIALFAGLACWQLTGIRSGFAQAARFLATRHRDGALVTNEIMKFYLRDSTTACDVATLPRHASPHTRLGPVQYGYAVVDIYNTPAKRYLLHHADRVARYLIAGTSSLAENPVATENGQPPDTQLGQHVDIYRLAGQSLRQTQPAQHRACSLQRLV